MAQNLVNCLPLFSSQKNGKDELWKLQLAQFEPFSVQVFNDFSLHKKFNWCLYIFPKWRVCQKRNLTQDLLCESCSFMSPGLPSNSSIPGTDRVLLMMGMTSSQHRLFLHLPSPVRQSKDWNKGVPGCHNWALQTPRTKPLAPKSTWLNFVFAFLEAIKRPQRAFLASENLQQFRFCFSA